MCFCNKLDGVGSIDNRPSTEYLHHFEEEKKLGCGVDQWEALNWSCDMRANEKPMKIFPQTMNELMNQLINWLITEVVVEQPRLHRVC